MKVTKKWTSLASYPFAHFEICHSSTIHSFTTPLVYHFSITLPFLYQYHLSAIPPPHNHHVIVPSHSIIVPLFSLQHHSFSSTIPSLVIRLPRHQSTIPPIYYYAAIIYHTITNNISVTRLPAMRLLHSHSAIQSPSHSSVTFTLSIIDHPSLFIPPLHYHSVFLSG